MRFLNSLIKDPKYQDRDPRQPEEVGEPDVIISPDTRRENRIPPGQTRTKKWPVLDAHGAPPVDLATWKFEVDGLVERVLKFSLAEFMQLPAVKVYSDFHCVTRWSRLDNIWTGVPIPPEHGGPVRLIIPQLYAWKSAKWVKGVRFLAEDRAGFWEEGGYHMRGNPWAAGDGERFR